ALSTQPSAGGGLSTPPTRGPRADAITFRLSSPTGAWLRLVGPGVLVAAAGARRWPVDRQRRRRRGGTGRWRRRILLRERRKRRHRQERNARRERREC